MDTRVDTLADKKFLPENYEIIRTDKGETGLTIWGLKDKQTGITTTFWEPNSEVDFVMFAAWVAATTSRNPRDYTTAFKEIYETMLEDPEFAANKIGTFLINYGHRSVGQLGNIHIGMNGIPIELAALIYYELNLGQGQEFSTRYKKVPEYELDDVSSVFNLSNLSETEVLGIRDMWNDVVSFSKEKYASWYDLIYISYANYLKSHDAETKNSTLTARTLDIVRFFIPLGAKTSSVINASIDEWNTIVKALMSRNNYLANQLGEQVNALMNLSGYEEGENFQTHLESLTRRNQPYTLVEDNKRKLNEYLLEDSQFKAFLEDKFGRREITHHPTEVRLIELSSLDELDNQVSMMIAQYIWEFYPQLEVDEIIKFLTLLSDEKKAEIGKIVMEGHDRHNELGHEADTRGLVFIIKTSVAYFRDLVRHRSSGRVSDIFESSSIEELITNGFNRNYQLSNSTFLQKYEEEFNKDLSQMYSKIKSIYDFLSEKGVDNLNGLLQLLPFAHQTEFHFSMPLKQLSYIASLRGVDNKGGDYGYMNVAYKMVELARENPFLKGWFENAIELDPNNPDQIIQRG